jgi:predicted ArsR family transcriptional regulator
VAERLEILKTLGDNTRYAIYLELARSVRPLATAEIADILDLHPNTVRPHLERMRDLGLVEVSSAPTGAVVARVLLEAAAAGGLDPEDLADAGREQGRADHQRASRAGHRPDGDVVDELEAELAELGFDPARADEGAAVTIAFTHCPYRQLAEDHPELVCSMHQGMVEGFVACGGGAVIERFHPLVDRTPCQVDLLRTG